MSLRPKVSKDGFEMEKATAYFDIITKHLFKEPGTHQIC